MRAQTEPWTNVAAGAGFIGGTWPDTAADQRDRPDWFSGNIAEVAWYPAS